MVNILRRHKLMDKILYVSFLILLLFAWFDSEEIIGIKRMDNLLADPQPVWGIYFEQIMPAIFWMWLGVLACIGIIWYLYSKDKSESLALFLTPSILIYFGVQDIIYYIISPDIMVYSMGCWADVILPVKIISDFLGETCPTANALILSSIIGIGVAYYTYKKLKKARW